MQSGSRYTLPQHSLGEVVLLDRTAIDNEKVQAPRLSDHI